MKKGDIVVINQKKGVVISRMLLGKRYKISVKFSDTDIGDYFEDTVRIQLSSNKKSSYPINKNKKKSKK